MSFEIKKITAAIGLLLMAGSALGAGGNYISVDGSGSGNEVNINTDTATSASVKIYQIGDGTGVVAAQKNLVGTNSSSKVVVGTDAIVRIGQGKYFDDVTSNFASTSISTHGNLVKSSSNILDGVVQISQLSNNNTADVSTSANGTGKVIVNQGYQNADTSTSIPAGGAGFNAIVNQAGTGWIKINQGNSGDSQANAGSATVVHDGSTTVNIVQNRTTAGSTGAIFTNTSGDSGNVDIRQSNNGNIFVNRLGDAANATSIAVTADVHLVNEGTGTIAIKQVGTTGATNVYAYLAGGNLTVDDGGLSGNNIYVNNAQNSSNASSGMTGGNVTINGAAGNYANTVKIANFSAGDLTINQNGHNNLVKVDSFVGGGATVNQSASSYNSNLYLTSSGNPTTGFAVNQNGAFQNITVDIRNTASPTTLDANISGTAASYATINGSI